MQNIPRVNVTRPVRPLTQQTAELMSTRRPAINGPYGLDADIEQVVFLPKVGESGFRYTMMISMRWLLFHVVYTTITV